MITLGLFLSIHETILETEPELKGQADLGNLDSALARIDNWMLYENTDNIFDIAAYCQSHTFPDGNKCTTIVTMLTYLDLQGVEIPPDHGLDDTMVDVASSKLDFIALFQHLQQMVN